MTIPDAVILPDLLVATLESSRPVIYDIPIGLRELYVDPDTGDEHYLVHYPAGMRAVRHHHSAAHTIIVLNGLLSANGHILGPGSYCHFPAMVVMHHEPAAGNHCRFVTIFHGPFDVFPDEGLDGEKAPAQLYSDE
jgi:quercetin dioxygenase-like cupin family protein